MLPKIKITIERWKFNKEFNLYVSNQGRVRDTHKRVVEPYIGHDGYQRIFFEGQTKGLHRLVMLTWCPIENHETMTVDHLDSNKRNNAVSNLQWVTETENKQRARKRECYMVTPADFALLKKAKSMTPPTLNKKALVSFDSAIRALWENSPSIRASYDSYDAFWAELNKRVSNGRQRIYGLDFANTGGM